MMANSNTNWFPQVINSSVENLTEFSYAEETNLQQVNQQVEDIFEAVSFQRTTDTDLADAVGVPPHQLQSTFDVISQNIGITWNATSSAISLNDLTTAFEFDKIPVSGDVNANTGNTGVEKTIGQALPHDRIDCYNENQIIPSVQFMNAIMMSDAPEIPLVDSHFGMCRIENHSFPEVRDAGLSEMQELVQSFDDNENIIHPKISHDIDLGLIRRTSASYAAVESSEMKLASSIVRATSTCALNSTPAPLFSTTHSHIKNNVQLSFVPTQTIPHNQLTETIGQRGFISQSISHRHLNDADRDQRPSVAGLELVGANFQPTPSNNGQCSDVANSAMQPIGAQLLPRATNGQSRGVIGTNQDTSRGRRAQFKQRKIAAPESTHNDAVHSHDRQRQMPNSLIPAHVAALNADDDVSEVDQQLEDEDTEIVTGRLNCKLSTAEKSLSILPSTAENGFSIADIIQRHPVQLVHCQNYNVSHVVYNSSTNVDDVKCSSAAVAAVNGSRQSAATGPELLNSRSFDVNLSDCTSDVHSSQNGPSSQSNGLECTSQFSEDNFHRPISKRRRDQNRKAAQRCRQKKKNHENTLSKNLNILKARKVTLEDEVKKLEGTALLLSDFIRRHRQSPSCVMVWQRAPSNISNSLH